MNCFAELGRLIIALSSTHPSGCFATFGNAWRTDGAAIGKVCDRLKGEQKAGSSIPSLSKIAEPGAQEDTPLDVDGLEFLLCLRN